MVTLIFIRMLFFGVVVAVVDGTRREGGEKTKTELVLLLSLLPSPLTSLPQVISG